MPKYNDIKEGQKFTPMDEMLLKQAIANELAEANRLKIIELNMLKINLGIPEKFDLEDKA